MGSVLHYSINEFVTELKRNDEITVGDLVHFVDYYGVHKFFVDLWNIVDEHMYMIIAHNYHFTKDYFDQH